VPERDPGGGPTLRSVEDWEEIEAGATTWRFESSFLRSSWTCLWGQGCQGIRPEPAEAMNEGCCSFGANLQGDEAGGVFSDDARTNTRVVDDACIFLNRPGFSGGEGCALHLAALADGDSPLDWKPSVCWQLPVKVDWADREGGGETATVHRWTRHDWGEIGDEMAWCCTEGPEAYVGDRPVIESLAEEIEEVVGPEVFVELRRRLS